MQWNIMAEGLANDGFIVRDVLNKAKHDASNLSGANSTTDLDMITVPTLSEH
jgi:hypothetical protein